MDQLRLKALHIRDQAWDDEVVHQIGLKVVILEGFYTLEEIFNAEDQIAVLEDIRIDIKTELEN